MRSGNSVLSVALINILCSFARSDVLSAMEDVSVSGGKRTRDEAGVLTEPESDVDVHRNPKGAKDERARDVEVRTFNWGGRLFQVKGKMEVLLEKNLLKKWRQIEWVKIDGVLQDDVFRYEGEVDEAGNPHGQGTFVLCWDSLQLEGQWKGSVSRYEGQWEHGMRHGRGKANFVGGLQYEGQFQHDERHVEGAITSQNGRRYEGQWEHGLRHGQGEHVYLDGSRYEGQWEQGKRHGKGKKNAQTAPGIRANGSTESGSIKKGTMPMAVESDGHLECRIVPLER